MTPLFEALKQRIPSNFRHRLGSLRTLLIFWNVVSLSLLMGSLGLAFRFITLSFMNRAVESELQRSVAMYSRDDARNARLRGLSVPPPDRPNPDPSDPNNSNSPPEGPRREDRPPPRPRDSGPLSPRLFYPDGTPEFNNNSESPIFDQNAFDRAKRGETVFVNLQSQGEPIRVLYKPGYDHRDREGVAQSAYPLKEVNLAVAGFDTALLLLLPIGLLGAVWMGSALTDRILRRVQGMTLAASRIGAHDISKRLPIAGDDEFSQLAITFNEMLGRLDGAFQEQKRVLESQRRFIADASHELKTPLTVIKGSSSLALNRANVDEKSRRAFQKIDQTADMMSQLVQDLLLLAHSDEGRAGRKPIELLTQEVLERAISEAVETGGATVSLSIEPSDLTFRGNEGELVRLFRNLVENALRYTPEEGKISLEARRSNADIVVKIADTGSGISKEHLPYLGERFYRVDGSRTRPTGGTGLGLSICRRIVEAHGGTLKFESELSVGTTVIVTLPALPGN